jgi:uracil-DNA glycosylase
MQQARGSVANSIDDDVRWLRDRAKTIHRDIHKMHAFVRFRKVGEKVGENVGAGDRREACAAWFEPVHYIMDLTASFFVKRFYAMNWR